jgi:hypothetical protein
VRGLPRPAITGSAPAKGADESTASRSWRRCAKRRTRWWATATGSPAWRIRLSF